MQGAGGCVPATPEFLRVLREECDRSGALLILDEVMTSRLHPGGLQCRLGITPDLTTLGKYLAGGLSIGAFGGRPDVMAHFAEQAGGHLRHSGTFNNNVLSMATAVAVLRHLLDDDVLLANSARGDRLRGQLDAAFAGAGLPMPVTGMGSVFHIHATDPRWLHWLFHELLADGYYISPRGLVALSLAVTDADCAGLLSAVRAWTRRVTRLHPVAA
jgi:glutamate-1-semialdehyde 2,1-aminomutase